MKSKWGQRSNSDGLILTLASMHCEGSMQMDIKDEVGKKCIAWQWNCGDYFNHLHLTQSEIDIEI